MSTAVAPPLVGAKVLVRTPLLLAGEPAQREAPLVNQGRGLCVVAPLVSLNMEHLSACGEGHLELATTCLTVLGAGALRVGIGLALLLLLLGLALLLLLRLKPVLLLSTLLGRRDLRRGRSSRSRRGNLWLRNRKELRQPLGRWLLADRVDINQPGVVHQLENVAVIHTDKLLHLLDIRVRGSLLILSQLRRLLRQKVKRLLASGRQLCTTVSVDLGLRSLDRRQLLLLLSQLRRLLRNLGCLLCV